MKNRFTALAVVALAVLFSAILTPFTATAAGQIADPPIPDGEFNLFATMQPGTNIRAGTVIGDCIVTDLVFDGYLNRSAYGPYAIGDTVWWMTIYCEQGITGTLHGGDNDPHGANETPSSWLIDGVEWTPACGANCWDSTTFADAHIFTFIGGGDSTFFTWSIKETPTALDTEAEPSAGPRTYLPAISR
jgi:hypothetical protein